MAANQPATKQSYGPGMLLLFGLILVGITAWCGRDFLRFSEQGQTAWKERDLTYLIFNGVGLFMGGILAVVCFVLAAIRSKKGIGSPTDDRGPAGNRPKES